VSFFVSLVLLLICAILFAVAQSQRKAFSQQCLDQQMCEFELPATYYQVSDDDELSSLLAHGSFGQPPNCACRVCRFLWRLSLEY
jgi:hypothetical protein